MSECREIMKLHNKLISSEKHPFTPKGTRVKVSEEQGVYIIYSLHNTVLHVGRTNGGREGLNQRLNNHRNDNSSFSDKYLKFYNIKLSEGCMFKYIVVKDSRKRALLEALTIGLICPAHIGTGEKSNKEK